MTPSKAQIATLSHCLAKHNLLSESDALLYYKKSLQENISFISYLTQHKLVDSLSIAQVASQEFGMPLFNLNTLDISYSPQNLIEEKLVYEHRIFPLFKRGNKLFIAIADPTNQQQALSNIKFYTGVSTEPILVEEDKLSSMIEKINQDHRKVLAELSNTLETVASTQNEDEVEENFIESDKEDAPIVRFVNRLLLDAINRGASDIHFEPYEKTYRVRYRQDGILHEVATPPVNLSSRITSRIKVMARLDIAERRVPQDGRMKAKISDKKSIDFRVSTCPTLFGEKAVLRILDPTSAQIGIHSLGYELEQQKIFLDTIHQSYGMVLVTGPTGSGKTVSLYTALNILNTGNINISTAEDPAEINVPGINQVNVHPKVGLTFASALRSFLRQDPDVIMVGEIRDLETAEIAIKAAQTGHMVLSTLHTNDAPQTLTRLVNMGVPSYNIASAVSLIIAQRLVRRLCTHCKTEEHIPDQVLLEEGFTEEQIADRPIFYKANGCDYCAGGYKGRIGIYQVMPVSEIMGEIIMCGGNSMELADQAKKEGISDLRQSGVKKIISGVTSLEEVNRVTKE
ncbi:type IV-A pilus assembly ATPase PilB [Candidatus Nitrosacidococcus tergens]|uniref:Type 4 fimbrial assembly protein PilB n=1 Tax=Candidatus Nitrosacidococcus tergens TaxID=553981 RepID=A0A7G1Q7V6_9GAMM|nr:type IV-A pilus assembly ATPase PilB [Candidatus Nitrosacidococcus tergens]CAB1274305.1 Type 4 fimbrial assembly protein PilB [Candidatus Nitrosacidococcus tergens]